MITLSNGHELEYVIASGAMGFDGQGWWWERPFVWAGCIKPELFTTTLRTLTRHPRLYPVSNLSWIRPWTWLPFSPFSCVRTISEGFVNKVGLWNKGIDWWCSKVGPYLDLKRFPCIGSIFGTEEELVEMAEMLNPFGLVGLEINPSCPNSGHPMDQVEKVVQSAKAVKKKSRHPLLLKLSVAQECIAIARALKGTVEAISLNSVPWEIAFPGRRSPLWRLEKPASPGGGGVSGRPAQLQNWQAVIDLTTDESIPVIAPSIMEFEDIRYAKEALGASAVSFGAIHLPSHPVWLKPWTIFTNPLKPTRFVLRDMAKG